MEIIKKEEAGKIVLSLIGKLDTTTAPNLEKVINEISKDEELVLDFKDLSYVSSAGLRVLLIIAKKFDDKHKLINVCEDVMDVFEITGFDEVLNIEI